MITKEQIQLNVLKAYIQYVRDLFPTETYESRRYILILRIREWQLRRRKMKRVQTVEDLETLKHGHREAERFYFDFLDDDSPNQSEKEIIDILQSIAVEFHEEILEIEAQHPELKAEFAREREQYRLRWNWYVEKELEHREAIRNEL